MDFDEVNHLEPMKFKRLMYGEWIAPTEQEKHLEEAAKEYHDRCDAYDQRVCTARSPRTGEPIPANGDQQGAINNNAWWVRNDILMNYNITEAELHKAIQAYNKR